MSKKSGLFAPKDRSAAVEAFVSQGGGAEIPAEAVKAKLPPRMPPGGKATRLNVDLPQELHRRFKTACAAEGVKMAEIVAQLVQDWTEKHR